MFLSPASTLLASHLLDCFWLGCANCEGCELAFEVVISADSSACTSTKFAIDQVKVLVVNCGWFLRTGCILPAALLYLTFAFFVHCLNFPFLLLQVPRPDKQGGREVRWELGPFSRELQLLSVDECPRDGCVCGDCWCCSPLSGALLSWLRSQYILLLCLY